jgi:uncharacterized protein (TIGR03083 family)
MSSPEQDQLARLVEVWHVACANFVALARSLPREQWDLPTDLEGWSVKDNVAHTAHLEAVLAGAPEETLEVAAAPHLVSFVNFYTEQGVLARRGRDMAELTDEIERSVALRYAELQAAPPTDGRASPPRTPGGAGWNVQTLLGNRPVDVWMHEQDVRRAVGRPGGYDSPAAAHTLRALGRALPMVVGKRVAPPPGTTIRVDVPDAGLCWTVQVGDDGRAAALAGEVAGEVAPTTTVSLSAEDFVVLSGGRRGPETTTPVIEGDAETAQRLLSQMAVTP